MAHAPGRGFYQFDLRGQSDDFKAGIFAALNFFDGSDGYQLHHAEGNLDSITLTVQDQDNATFKIVDKRIQYDQGGVEL